MTSLAFSKWQGTGNDFILIDDRDGVLLRNVEPMVPQLCDRHFGIGSDGVILLRPPEAADEVYRMEFMNPDGSRSFCGNGSRCAYAYWCALTGSRDAVRFSAVDGTHEARWVGGSPSIAMRAVERVERLADDTDRVHTGSPHLIRWGRDPDDVDVVAESRAIRYSEPYRREGINVNFAQWAGGRVRMRTYERGVEAETLSCGTGVTAAAISAMERGWTMHECTVETRGGLLQVEAQPVGGAYHSIWLTGPATAVFTGSYPIGSTG